MYITATTTAKTWRWRRGRRTTPSIAAAAKMALHNTSARLILRITAVKPPPKLIASPSKRSAANRLAGTLRYSFKSTINAAIALTNLTRLRCSRRQRSLGWTLHRIRIIRRLRPIRLALTTRHLRCDTFVRYDRWNYRVGNGFGDAPKPISRSERKGGTRTKNAAQIAPPEPEQK